LGGEKGAFEGWAVEGNEGRKRRKKEEKRKEIGKEERNKKLARVTRKGVD
jgi:hypothetical protein